MPPIGAEDEDVARERERVKGGRAQGDILTMTDLSKVEHMGSVWSLMCSAFPKHCSLLTFRHKKTLLLSVTQTQGAPSLYSYSYHILCLCLYL